jgi:type IV pilus assembly protein PilF
MKRGSGIGSITTFLLASLLLSGCVSSTNMTKMSVDTVDAYQQHLNLAMQYIGMNNRDLARIHLVKAEKYFNSSDKVAQSQFYNGYALLYQIELELVLAEKYFRKALDGNAENSTARYNFASFLFNQERFEDALDQILIVTEDLNYQRRPQAFYIAGLLENKREQPDRALRFFIRATELSPLFRPPYIESAKIYMGQQNLVLAKKQLLEHVGLAGPTADNLWLSIRLETHLGNNELARIQGEKLKMLYPDSKEAAQYATALQY